MSNINNYYFNNLDLKLSNSDYWDLYLASDEKTITPFNGVSSGDCFVVWYDFNNINIYPSGNTSGNTIISLLAWTGATNTGFTFNTIGLTGIDNGLITFDKTSGDTSNLALLSALTGSTLVIPSGNTKLMLTRVTGTTGNYIYPIDYINNSGATLGSYVNLCGGFFQGFYKIDGYDYQVLPTRSNKAWVLDFWLNKTELNCSGYTGTTLNDIYPNNKGFFFYMGTRAENKFWNVFEGLNTGCTSACISTTGCTDIITNFCTIPKETDIILTSGYPLSPPTLIVTEIKNQFLIYNMGVSGHTVCDFTGDSITVKTFGTIVTDHRNPFLVYNMSTGNTVCDFTGFTSPQLELDIKADIIDNALGFMIKDDGSIGYRLLTYTGYCIGNTFVTGVTIEEKYSASGIVSNDIWTNIVIRFVANENYDDCQLKINKARKGRLMFYVNGMLKFIVDDFDEFIARRLNEYKDKQIGVPFNISLGGGSQGLLESQTFDGQDPKDIGLYIEKNFSGSFIGSLSQFKFYLCDLNWCDIKNNYELDRLRYL